MNNHRDLESGVNTGWECIDPNVGRSLWQLGVDETTLERKQQLQAHLQLCDACRLEKALDARLEAGLQSGQLVLPVSRNRSWWRRSPVQATAGAALVAATLALLMLLPPAPTGDIVSLRGAANDPHFLRPVEGELVVAERTELKWNPIAGATKYQVTLTDVAGDFHWQNVTHETRLELPVLDQERQTLRAVLSTVPADLLSPGQVSVSFSTGSWAQMAGDRFQKAPLGIYFLLMGGTILIGLSFFSRRSRESTA